MRFPKIENLGQGQDYYYVFRVFNLGTPDEEICLYIKWLCKLVNNPYYEYGQWYILPVFLFIMYDMILFNPQNYIENFKFVSLKLSVKLNPDTWEKLFPNQKLYDLIISAKKHNFIIDSETVNEISKVMIKAFEKNYHIFF